MLCLVQTLDATLLANNSQHCCMLHVVSVCTPCCMLLRIVRSLQSLNPVKLLAKCKQTQQAPTMLGVVARPFARSLTLFGTASICIHLHKPANTYATTPNNHCCPTTPNIVRCYLLRPFAHPVACCCTKFETDQTSSFVQTDATTPINVGSCWPTMFRPFARGFRHKTIQTKAP